MIGALQKDNGLKRSRDRSKKGYERFVGLGILGRNLQTLGKLLLAQDKATARPPSPNANVLVSRQRTRQSTTAQRCMGEAAPQAERKRLVAPLARQKTKRRIDWEKKSPACMRVTIENLPFSDRH